VLEKRAGYFFGNLDVYVNIVGGITNDRPYTTEIALDFLPAGRTFTMTSFEDGVNADLQATDYRKRVREVDASTVVKVEMVRNGGWAAVIE